MSEKLNSSPYQKKFRSYSIVLFQFFIVICLVDGFLDIVYPLAKIIKSNFGIVISEIRNATAAKTAKSQDVSLPPLLLPLQNKPGIRNIVAEYHSKSINVSEDGQRYNGEAGPQKVRYTGFLLGSSTAFGYGVDDNQTIAAHLERALNETKIYNYAGLAQPTPDNILRWYDLQKNKVRPDFVILTGTEYQLYADCKPTQVSHLPEKTRSNIFQHLTGILADKFSNKKIKPCSSDESLELAVRNSIISLENAVMFARKQGVPFYIVNLPTPYYSNINISNLSTNPDAMDYIATMQRVFDRYHREVTKLDFPELIDLSHALPSDKNYFIDMGGHLSKEGSEVVSEKIFEHIWGDKGQVTTRLPQHMTLLHTSSLAQPR